MLFSVIEKYPEIRLTCQRRYSGQDIKWEATGDVIKAYFTFSAVQRPFSGEWLLKIGFLLGVMELVRMVVFMLCSICLQKHTWSWRYSEKLKALSVLVDLHVTSCIYQASACWEAPEGEGTHIHLFMCMEDGVYSMCIVVVGTWRFSFYILLVQYIKI